MVKTDAKEKGWKPMPIIFKVLFIWLCYSLLTTFLTSFMTYSFGFFLFGAYLTIWAAVLSSLVINVFLVGILCLGIWNRSRWTSIYGVFYFIVILINNILSIANFRIITQALFSNIPLAQDLYSSEIMGAMSFGMVIGMVIGAIINIVFMVLFFVFRSYFSEKSEKKKK